MAIKVAGAKKKKKKRGLIQRAGKAVKKLVKRARGKAAKKKAGTSTSG